MSTPTEAAPAETTLYALLGGADGVFTLVDRFYEHMDSLPEARAIRAMHGADLARARERLYDFLSGWLGGPPLYVEKHGHPRLRARHLPFVIGPAERDAWMSCMHHALQDTVEDGHLRAYLEEALGRLATHMENTPATPPPAPSPSQT